MSLIIGINLSDRLYLSSDTRLTFRDNKGENYIDNILKISVLSNEMSVAAAGDLELSSFIVQNIIKSDIDKNNIRKFREDIEEVVKNLADEYLQLNKHLKSACFIFAGINRSEEKSIDIKRYREITTQFQKETNLSMGMKDVILKGLNRLGSGKVKVPSPLKIPTVDSHVFSISLLSQKLKIEDVPWGEFIAHGPAGFSRSKLPKTFFGQFEVAASNNPLHHDKMWLDVFFQNVVKENSIKVVGGCTTSFVVSENNSGILLGGTRMQRIGLFVPDETISEISIIDKKLHCFSGKERHRLIPFTAYQKFFLEKYPCAKNLSL